jgi:hypothetical protein
MCRGTIPQYTVLLSLCLVTYWFSPHYDHFIFNFISLLFLSPRKSKLNFLLALTVPVFFTRSLGCLKLFSNSPYGASLAASHKVQLPS